MSTENDTDETPKDEAKPIDPKANFIVESEDTPEGLLARQEGVNEVYITDEKPKANADDNEGDPNDQSGNDDTADNEDDAEAKDGDEGDAKPKSKSQRKKQKFQNRINELTGKAKRSEIENETAQAENKRLKAENEFLKGKQNTKGKDDEAENKPPQEDDYDNYDDFLNATEAYEAEEEKGSSKPEAKPESENSEGNDDHVRVVSSDTQVAQAILVEAVKSAEDLPKDFHDVTRHKDLVITGDMVEALSECDNPTDVLYHLGQNPDLSKDIADKTAIQQVRAISQLDGSQPWNDPGKEKPNQSSEASDPIEPVNASSAQEKAMNSLKTTDFSEYERRRNAENRKGSSDW